MIPNEVGIQAAMTVVEMILRQRHAPILTAEEREQMARAYRAIIDDWWRKHRKEGA